MILPLCPTCHRRGSERIGVHVSVRHGREVRIPSGSCLSSFHDAADYGPMLLEAVKSASNWAKMFLMGCTIHESQELSCLEDEQRIDDLLAVAEGRKEDRDV